jgi:anti-sigma regulatory factor (Ser/Thr protein kinase)
MSVFRYHEQHVYETVKAHSEAALLLLEMIEKNNYTHAQRNRLDFAVSECVKAIREAARKPEEDYPIPF